MGAIKIVTASGRNGEALSRTCGHYGCDQIEAWHSLHPEFSGFVRVEAQDARGSTDIGRISLGDPVIADAIERRVNENYVTGEFGPKRTWLQRIQRIFGSLT